jgi:tetraacyldisaccharide 4'-kinase
LGVLPSAWEATRPGAIWLHAVSVGEVLGAAVLARELKLRAPARAVYVSVTTLAGRETANQKLVGVADGVFFAPLDFRWVVRRVLNRLRPAVVVILETEIWPSLFHEAKRCGCGLLIANGRISDRALPRYRRFRKLFEAVLEKADAVLAQSDRDRERFLAIGAPPERTRTMGNLKFDVGPAGSPPDAIADLIRRVSPREIWIAASTMPPRDSGDVDEHAAVIQAFRAIARPGHLLILAPRRPDTFDAVAALLEREAIPHLRRSKLDAASALKLPGVLLIDSIGELASLFPLVDAVFMGGTLAARGGHNLLEPAFAAKPVVCGPHLENFAAMEEAFQVAGALKRIVRAEELGPAIRTLLDNRAESKRLGEAARSVARSESGAAARCADEVESLCQQRWPAPVRPLTARLLLAPLSWIWEAGGRWHRSRAVARKLPAPVISVGGIAMGGTGKSPVTAYLAEILSREGYSVAILTRGYGRRTPMKQVILKAGESAPTTLTGDEAQMYLEAGHAHLGIGADRCEAGRLLLERLDAAVLLLDDGLQHYRLARDLDLVLIDSLDPFAGGVFPLGRLREPPEALERAGVILLTRTDPEHSTAGLEHRLRVYNSRAPIFRAVTHAQGWRNAVTGEWRASGDLRAGAALAFCGLGNPESFRLSLQETGIRPESFLRFGDHHHYSPSDLRNIVAQARRRGATRLLTTQKDRANLPPRYEELLEGLELWWLQIAVRVEREQELLNLLRRTIGAARA